MFKTRITEMANVKYPVLMGGMQWLARAELVSAVANAGGLAFLTAVSCCSVKELREEIRRTRDLTDKPFGVNISMLPVLMPGDLTDAFMDLVCEEGIPVVETAGRSPEKYVDLLHDAGVKLFHKVPALRFAQKAESIGADAVIIVGFECGGHPGMDDVPSLIQTPAAAETLSIPVIAAGGYCDGKGLIAALALGAEGVLLGTRFMASEESPMHDNFKAWMINAQATDTMVVERSIRNAARIMKNEAARTVARMEAEGATLEELFPVIAGSVSREAYLSGDLDQGTIACGQAVGRIREIKPVAAIMADIMDEAKSVLARLNNLAQS
ncbi:MAG: nitronate monooxygenase [Candidatus Hydrogenedens sp.]|jgi:nitronate monooxygenase|nr:nitronate monooxygenase [Candidatus Hydrogenedens sp.]